MLSRLGLSRVLIGVAIGLGVADVGAAREMPMEAPPLGQWVTRGGGVIEIGWCGTTLCGRIVGIPRAQGEPAPVDYQGRSQCGLTIITDEHSTEGGVWLGNVTDPRDGKTYQAELWVDNAHRLNLRGFIGVPLLGRTEIWDRFRGGIADDCRVEDRS
jgi:uncharacterized protein (DUF2147 family)